MSESLWQRLHQAGLVKGEQPVTPHWRSRLLLGACGWLAALFLLIALHLSLGETLLEPRHALALGCALLLTARLLLARQGRRELVAQLVLALALTGDGWLLYALLDEGDPQSARLWLTAALGALVIALLFAHWLLRLFHGFACALLLSLALACLGLQALAQPLLLLALLLLWYASGQQPRHYSLWESQQLGIALALLTLTLAGVIGEASLDPLGWFVASRLPHWLAPLLSLPLLGLLARRAAIPWRLVLPLMAAAAVIPWLGGAALLLLIGFHGGHRGLWSLGLLLLIASIGLYYYDLNLTLMTKSLLLGLLGLLLLVTRHMLRGGRNS